MKIATLATLIVLMTSPAFAQQPPAITFTVTVTEADVIGEGLAELPYKKSQPLMDKLRLQAQAQQPKATTPATPAAPAIEAPKAEPAPESHR